MTRNAKPTLPEPTPSEREAIELAKRRRLARKPRLKIKFGEKKSGVSQLVGSPHSDQDGWTARLEEAFGSRGIAFPTAQISMLVGACQDSNGTVDPTTINAMLAMIEGSEPANEIQAALAVEMALTHAAALRLLRRAMAVDQIPQFDSAATAATKFLRLFTLQAETLARLQRGGAQEVKVVHVYPGGQAIVGNLVSPSNPLGSSDAGGGGSNQYVDQPHAKAQLPAPSAQMLPEVRRAHAERQGMPIARGAR